MCRIESYGQDVFSDTLTLGGIIAIFALGWFSHALDMGKESQTIEHESDRPTEWTDLGAWTPHRVEMTFDSGLTVVSSLGPHGNYQYVVSGLDLQVGTTFRNFNGHIVEAM